jgi:hypothetical protein
VYDEPAEEEEDDDSGPEDPLVLLGAALDHAYRVAADAQGVCDAVDALLGALEHLALVAQVAQHGAAAVEELVELVRRVLEKGVLAQHRALAVVVAAGRGAGRVGIGPVGGVWVVGLRGRPGRVCGGGGRVGQRVGVLGGGGVVRAAAEQLGACCGSLLRVCQSPSPHGQCMPRTRSSLALRMLLKLERYSSSSARKFLRRS